MSRGTLIFFATLLAVLFFRKENESKSGPPEPLPILANVTGMANATTITNAVANTPPQSILSLSPGIYRVLKSELADDNSQGVYQQNLVNLVYMVVYVTTLGGSRQLISQGDPVRIVTISTEPRKDAMVPGDVFLVKPDGTINFVRP